jgi:dTDP-glucose 4,6-dehydratase
MNVLVTGAAGFIGSNLVHYIAEQRPGWRVTALDALTYAGNLKNIQSLVESDGNVSFVRTDITDRAAVESVFDEGAFDLVFHLAAESHVDRSILSSEEFVTTNIYGTQVLVDVARSRNVERFVHISTDEVYGSLGPSGAFVETTPLDPTSPYAASKAASDLMVLAAYKTHGYNVSVTRCTNNFGPYHFPEKLIPLFITNAMEDKPLPLYGDGLNVRSWVYVVDHCEALVLVAEKGRAGEVYNIGGGADAELTNKRVTQLILSALDKPETLIQRVGDRPAHDRRYAIDHAKITSELGWKPRTSLEQGLQQTIDWYVKNEAWWREIKSGEYLSYYEKNYGCREVVG